MTIKYTNEFRRDAVCMATSSGLTRPKVASRFRGQAIPFSPQPDCYGQNKNGHPVAGGVR